MLGGWAQTVSTDEVPHKTNEQPSLHEEMKKVDLF